MGKRRCDASNASPRKTGGPKSSLTAHYGVDGGLRLTPNPPFAAFHREAPTDLVMPNYRRVFVDGGCWFFTVNLEDRRSRLLTEHIGALREAVAKVRRRRPFDIDAWVVLPDHLHAASRPGTATFRRAGA